MTNDDDFDFKRWGSPYVEGTNTKVHRLSDLIRQRVSPRVPLRQAIREVVARLLDGPAPELYLLRHGDSPRRLQLVNDERRQADQFEPPCATYAMDGGAGDLVVLGTRWSLRQGAVFEDRGWQGFEAGSRNAISGAQGLRAWLEGELVDRVDGFEQLDGDCDVARLAITEHDAIRLFAPPPALVSAVPSIEVDESPRIRPAKGKWTKELVGRVMADYLIAYGRTENAVEAREIVAELWGMSASLVRDLKARWEGEWAPDRQAGRVHRSR